MANVTFTSADQLEAEKAMEAENTEEARNASQTPVVIENLASHIMGKWQIAKDAKRIHEDNFIRNLKDRNGQYPASTLAAMRAMFGSDYEPLFMMIPETKCRTAESWIRETIFQPGERPYGGDPTEIPDLPEEIKRMVRAEVFNKVLEMALQEATQATATAQAPDGTMVQMEPEIDPSLVIAKVQELMPQAEEHVKYELKEQAREAADKMLDKIEDQFQEGNWYEALDQGIFDIVTFGTMILKGPCFKKSPAVSRELNPETGVWETNFKVDVLPFWERRSPFNIYPSPDATSIEDGWIFDRLQLSRRALSDLIGIEGYSDENIRAALREFKDGGLRDWLSIDMEKQDAEGRDSSSMQNSETIECLEYHGSIQGSLLIGWGMSLKEIPDPEKEYDVILWQIGNYVIKATINPDPLRRKYFYRAAFAENPDMFWGKGVPQLIRSVSTLANSTARAIAHNIAISAGPITEIDEGRLAPGEEATIYPWKVIRSTNAQMMESAAVKFYQPNPITQRLLEVYSFCMNLADEDSGVPRYMQGNAQGVQGAGDTASGLNMLMTHAAKGVRSVIRNIDNGIIEKCLKQIYSYNMQWEQDIEVIGDIRFIPKGSAALVEKGQLAQRRTELLNTTANPFDVNILGLNGRKELIKQNLIALGIDYKEVLSDEDIMENSPMGPEQAGAPEPASGVGGSQRGSGQIGAPPPAQTALAPDGGPQGGMRAPSFQSPKGVTP